MRKGYLVIKYKCAFCGAKLETEDSQSGRRETCPACGKNNPVPLSEADKEARQKEKPKPRSKGLDSFYTKVAGVSHRNDDGTYRQRIIRRCRPQERLVLDHDERNPHDPNAVRVCRQSGEQVGFLNAELAEEVVSAAREGYRYAAFVKNITGGTEDRPTLGMNLLMVVADPGMSDREAQNYVDTLDLSDADMPGRVDLDLGHGGGPRKAGCFGLLVLFFLALAAAWLLGMA